MSTDGALLSGNPRSQAVSTQHVAEGSFELLTEARVDDGVNAAVEVTQPEGYLEDGFRRLTGWKNRSWKRQKEGEMI